MRGRCITSLMLCACASAATVKAQDARVELHAGVDRFAQDNFFSPSDSTFKPIENAVYGLGVGYDFPLGERMFAGVEGNLDFSTGSRCQVNPLILAPGIFESCLEPGRDLSANARFGLKFNNGNTRLYGLAGYSNLRVKSSTQVNRVPTNFVRFENRDGIRAGIGIEHDFSGRFYGKLEYRYSDYGSDGNRNQGLVGVGLRF